MEYTDKLPLEEKDLLYIKTQKRKIKSNNIMFVILFSSLPLFMGGMPLLFSQDDETLVTAIIVLGITLVVFGPLYYFLIKANRKQTAALDNDAQSGFKSVIIDKVQDKTTVKVKSARIYQLKVNDVEYVVNEDFYQAVSVDQKICLVILTHFKKVLHAEVV